MILDIEPDKLAETLYAAFVKAVKETNPHPGLVNWRRVPEEARRQWNSMARHIIADHGVDDTE
jgi:hypothetical protein